MLFIQFPNHRRMRNDSKGGVVDVRCGQANNLEEFGHEAKTILCSAEKAVGHNCPTSLGLN